ncbi:hypothetical protein QBC40DRAFT_269088 [Triangularia verruculosa]|uniref:Uncharacterized protein n=1 Tax=Triangularia verruculosa TaxID=2587418 RepID=A0AAN6XA61_9PEZI|nr:hypothetical protein QBC40DRAFT_269088 [Triangularia verruculosa]
MKTTTKNLSHLFLFEPLDDSPISILWDLVLAFYVVRLAFLYSLLTLSSHLALSYLVPSTSALTATTILAAALWTRYVMKRWRVPRAAGFRGAVGVLAGGMVFVMEELVWGVGYEIGSVKLMEGMTMGFGLMGWVMGMPVLMAGVEGVWEGWMEKGTGRGLELGRSY